MPIVLLRALAARIPRLEATESLRRAAEIALGSGTLRKEDASSLRRSWLHAAGVGPKSRPVHTAADLEEWAGTSGVELVKDKGVARVEVKVDG